MNIKGAGGQTRTQQPRPRHGTGIAVTLAANDLTPPTPPPPPPGKTALAEFLGFFWILQSPPPRVLA